MKDVTPAIRAGFLLPLALCAGLQVLLLFVLGGRGFAWTFTSPLSAATMGAGYCGGLAMLVSALRLRRWVDVRVAYLSTLLLMILMLLVTLRYADQTHLGGGDIVAFGNAWGWLIVHLLAPVVGAVLLVVQLRAPGRIPPREFPRLWFTVLPIAVVAVIGTGVGLFALLRPAAAADAWPWPVSELDVSALGVWALVFGVGSILAIREGDPDRQRAGAVNYLVAGTASVIAFVRYLGEVRWDNTLSWIYLVLMILLALTGAIGWLMAGPAERWRSPALAD
ncbi:hypothetical protein GCM10010168_42830 [Actinoplanes ianthinogenes]|uniref:Uncharacterized protein n=1 Tax=Actinoplanes ianthinogenes TaxID=122358 RepID=A0ABM7LVW1_9ACTN|nr:hypothetical protein [Actinoplanes ianthinogenes]BCJ43407.1 hypothetical protein Aiant_40640 [Actinoplanes ianthinogenes]GGR20320.1 hypothetical protein GCM10010168_42830 [Actinoplanes ianthinogenes]